MNKDKIKLLIFDLDGTIVNSIFDIADGVNHVLATMNRDPLTVENVQTLVGSGVKKLIDLALHDVSDEATLNKALMKFQKYYANNLTNKTRPYEGVIETLQDLSKFKKVIYSNKPQELTQKVIANLNMDPYFDLVRGADDTKYTRKPSPEGILYILQKLHIYPENTMMVGDSTHDIQAGKGAGVMTCAVTYGYRDEKVLAKESPDLLIHHLSELRDYYGIIP